MEMEWRWRRDGEWMVLKKGMEGEIQVRGGERGARRITR